MKPEFRVLSANPSRDICIAAISTGVAQPHEAIQITVTGGHTVPTTIAVAPGTKLLFVNHDPFPHRLYRVGNDAFKETETTPSGSRDWTASGPGRFEFRDKLSPTLRFFVVVDPGVVDVVYPGHNGTFAFRDLAVGRLFLEGVLQRQASRQTRSSGVEERHRRAQRTAQRSTRRSERRHDAPLAISGTRSSRCSRASRSTR